MTASEIPDHVRESYPYIDAWFYEWVHQNRHHHLICRECGNLTRLDQGYLASLGTEILEDYGCKADIDHLAIFGLCNNCQQTHEAGGHNGTA